MTTFDNDDQSGQPNDAVPFEAVTQLASNAHYISATNRLRELKAMHDELFRKPDEKKGDSGGEYERLKLEVGALQMAAGVKSVAYFDLRITNADGGTTKPELTGNALLEAADALGRELSPADLRSIVIAAIKLDAKRLMQLRIPATLIEAARKLLGEGKPRAGSVRVEWSKKGGMTGGGMPGGAAPGDVQ